jgi:sphingolipid delta-4 desaturase
VDKVLTEVLELPAAVGSLPAATRGISEQSRQHNEMRKRVIENHPDVLKLAGPDWRTAVAGVGLLGIHWTTIYFVAQTNLLIVFVVALCFGQFVYHSALTLVHESAHRLVVRDKRGKLAFDLLLEAILTSFSRQLTYQHNHITSHHPHLGDYEGDYEHEDMCQVLARRKSRAENPRLQRLLTLGQLCLHLLPYGFITERLVMPRYLANKAGLAKQDKIRDIGATMPSIGERRLFALFSLCIHVFIFVTFGFLGWLYHVWTMSLAMGRAGITTNGQFLSEHPGDDTEHPTRSTYSWSNLFLFNTGYHNEHHTFPNVAWMKLPRLKRAAPETFNVANTRSYFRFWWDQVKSDFDAPNRRSARDPGNMAARCELEAA